MKAKTKALKRIETVEKVSTRNLPVLNLTAIEIDPLKQKKKKLLREKGEFYLNTIKNIPFCPPSHYSCKPNKCATVCQTSCFVLTQQPQTF